MALVDLKSDLSRIDSVPVETATNLEKEPTPEKEAMEASAIAIITPEIEEEAAFDAEEEMPQEEEPKGLMARRN